MSKGQSYYEFIPVNGTRRDLTKVETPRSVLKKAYIFDLKFSTVSDLHSGNGKAKTIYKDKNVPALLLINYRNGEGIPCVPGSSLKGAVSTNYLTLTGSINSTSELFGATTKELSVMSKIFFSDLVPINMPKMIQIPIQRGWEGKGRQKHVKIYVSKAPSTSQYGFAECIPKETLLATRIQGIELKDYEVGGLLTSMGLKFEKDKFTTSPMKIGYGKPQGLGQIQLSLKESKLSLINFKLLKNIETLDLENANIGSYIKAFYDKFKDRKPAISSIYEKLFRRF